jgi:hypothetical protein
MVKKASSKIVAEKYMKKTAGEVRFVKDTSNDASQWAFQRGENDRSINPDYAFDPKNIKPLASVLRSTVASLGHVMSAYSTFAKVKSALVSPDGKLGGKGYIQRIPEVRRQYMNIVEALSAISDTLYDEVRAPHWAAISRQKEPEDQAEIAEIISDAEEIKEDPESWAEEQEEEMDAEHKTSAVKATPVNKQATHNSRSATVAQLWLEKRNLK